MKKFFDRYKVLPILTVMVIAFALSACNTSSDSGMGTMRVSLTDAPALFDQVNIEITQILVNKNGSSDDTTDAGWEAIMSDSLTINLLDYQNGETIDLGETELEPGTYNQIRLLLGNNNNVVVAGETIPLTTPSAQQSGYKLNIQADVEAGEVYELVIDFDATQSITVTGNGRYILKPVLRTVNLQNQASISGTVSPLEAEPIVYAIMGTDSLSTQPDDQGNFKIVGLDEGTYDVWVEPTNVQYADTLIEDLSLEASEEFVFEDTIQLSAVSL